MAQGMKICPRCALQAPIDAQNCAGCGHQYRTQFAPPDQTVAFVPPGSQPYGQNVQYQQFQQPAQRDEFEWKMQVAWLWGLAFIASHGVYLSVRALTTSKGLIAVMSSPFAFVAAFGLLTFCWVRLRRLYRYDAPHRTGWGITLTILLGLMLCSVITIEAKYIYPEQTSEQRTEA